MRVLTLLFESDASHRVLRCPQSQRDLASTKSGWRAPSLSGFWVGIHWENSSPSVDRKAEELRTAVREACDWQLKIRKCSALAACVDQHLGPLPARLVRPLQAKHVVQVMPRMKRGLFEC